MKILIKYSHGLGDVIALTPQLRYFHQQGHTVDLLVRGEVVGSCLLNNCPYVRHINVIRNPWEAEDYEKVEAGNVALLETISTYDRRINVDHKDIPEDILKSKFNSIQCGITEDIDMKKEVFISDANMRHVIEEVWMGNHIMPYNFVHTLIVNHP